MPPRSASLPSLCPKLSVLVDVLLSCLDQLCPIYLSDISSKTGGVSHLGSQLVRPVYLMLQLKLRMGQSESVYLHGSLTLFWAWILSDPFYITTHLCKRGGCTTWRRSGGAFIEDVARWLGEQARRELKSRSRRVTLCRQLSGHAQSRLRVYPPTREEVSSTITEHCLGEYLITGLTSGKAPVKSPKGTR